MRKVVLIALSLTVTIICAVGQGYTFRVLANKGQNQIKKSGTASAVALKTGATLSQGDELIASQGAYIALMHKSGRTLEVKTAGKRKVVDLEKQVNVKSKSVSSRYAKFLASKMAEKEDASYRQRLNATGAVDRGTNEIDILLPREVSVLGSYAIITWDAPNGIKKNEYIVSVKNIFGDEIHQEDVTGNVFNLDFASEKLKDNKELFIVSIQVKGNEKLGSGEIGIKKLEGKDAKDIQSNLDKLKAEVSEEDPINKIIYASFFEENGLILDALTQMEELITANPDIKDFEELKKDMMERNGIKIFVERNKE
ncbi:MAG: hypothetical protein AAGA66_04300 [Bacteroidota bacterium]